MPDQLNPWPIQAFRNLRRKRLRNRRLMALAACFALAMLYFYLTGVFQ